MNPGNTADAVYLSFSRISEKASPDVLRQLDRLLATERLPKQPGQPGGDPAWGLGT